MLLKPFVKVEPTHSAHSVAEVFRFGNWLEDYRRQYGVSYQQAKAVNDILKCRTAALGGYLKQCDSCGKLEIAYCACKNRHCPGCGHFEKGQWLEKQKALLLPAPYFQVVFTLDHVFLALVWHHPQAMFDLLFQTASRLLLAYGQKYLRGTIGFTAVLHTWGQTMQAHPHLHCMVSGGALRQTSKGGRWQAAKKKFLFPVVKLSADFRQAFCQGVKALAQQGQLAWDEAEMGSSIADMVTAAMSQKWEVYIEPPPNKADNGSPETLADYLARYFHSIAISHHRLVQIDDKGVTLASPRKSQGCNRRLDMYHKLYRVIDFKILSDYTIQVQFDDGTEQVINFEPVLYGEMWGPLRDPAIFRQVSLDSIAHTLTWPNGADFDPETLHNWPEYKEELTERVHHWVGVVV